MSYFIVLKYRTMKFVVLVVGRFRVSADFIITFISDYMYIVKIQLAILLLGFKMNAVIVVNYCLK